jgi:hypothetical protein
MLENNPRSLYIFPITLMESWTYPYVDSFACRTLALHLRSETIKSQLIRVILHRTLAERSSRFTNCSPRAPLYRCGRCSDCLGFKSSFPCFASQDLMQGFMQACHDDFDCSNSSVVTVQTLRITPSDQQKKYIKLILRKLRLPETFVNYLNILQL